MLTCAGPSGSTSVAESLSDADFSIAAPFTPDAWWGSFVHRVSPVLSMGSASFWIPA